MRIRKERKDGERRMSEEINREGVWEQCGVAKPWHMSCNLRMDCIIAGEHRVLHRFIQILCCVSLRSGDSLILKRYFPKTAGNQGNTHIGQQSQQNKATSPHQSILHELR